MFKTCFLVASCLQNFVCVYSAQIWIKDDGNLTRKIDVEKCLNDLISSSMNSDDVIYNLIDEIVLRLPHVRYDLEKPYKNILNRKMHYCIIDNANKTLNRIYNERFYNGHGKYIFVIKELSIELLKTISSFYLSKVVFIMQNTCKVYTYKPFLYGNLHEPDLKYIFLGTCNDKTLRKDTIFDDKTPKLWNNSTLQIFYNIVPPYLTCLNCSGTHAGIELFILNIVKEKLGFNTNFIHTNYVLWGRKINGSYDMLFGMLANRSGDMAFGCFHLRSEEHLDFDRSFTYLEDGAYWIVPMAKILPHWQRITHIINLEMYFIIIVIMLLVSITCFFLYQENIKSVMYILTLIIFEIALPKMPDYKAILSGCILSFMVISTLFKTNFILIMTSTQYSKQVSTLEEIIAADLIINIDYPVKNYYQNDNPVDKYVRDNFHYCPSPRVCINRTAFQQDMVTVDFGRAHMYNLPNMYIDEEGNALIYLFKNYIFPLYIHMFYVKGFPLIKQIDEILMQLKSNGIINHLYDAVEHGARKAMWKKSSLHSDVLTLTQMSIAFFIWALGIGLSLCVFIVEYCLNKIRNREEHFVLEFVK